MAKGRRARSGSVYALTLLTSMFVMIIGMSALAAARIHSRQARDEVAVIEAGFAAKSYIEVVMYRLASDPGWRFQYAPNTWSTEEQLQDTYLSFKLNDELDGTLFDDPLDPARLTARARVRGAVRMWSVDLNFRQTTNMLRNADMEAGLNNWTGDGPVGTCTLMSGSVLPHGGVTYIETFARSGLYAGPHQDVTSLIRNGETYYTEVWIRGQQSSNDHRVGLILNTSDGFVGEYFELSWSGFDWEEGTGTLTPTWTGTLLSAHWKVDTRSGSSDFAIDDAYLAAGQFRYGIEVAPGSWRREVE